MVNGNCIFYCWSGNPSFRVCLKNGYRYGIGVEYNKEGKTTYNGCFKDGNRYALFVEVKITQTRVWARSIWQSESHIYHKDENGQNHECYFYDQGTLSYTSRKEQDNENETLHRCLGNTISSYKDGNIVLKGIMLWNRSSNRFQTQDRVGMKTISPIYHNQRTRQRKEWPIFTILVPNHCKLNVGHNW